jgi:peptidyl-tRNA hydrolase, PTH1 family
MKLIVGLGNPGRKYAGTRHNVGFEIIDLIAKRHRLSWESGPADALMSKWRASGALLAKPLTFMNLSGHAVGELLRFFKIDFADLLIVVDDVNLELGRLRTRGGGSAGGHNGLKSLIAQLGTDAFARLRVGVGRGDARRDLGDHVLARFDADEQAILNETIGRAADAVELFVSDGIDPVMNRYNRKEEKDGKPGEDPDNDNNHNKEDRP